MDYEEARSLGRAITRARKERGLSQLRLAHAAGLGNTRIGALERGGYLRRGGGQPSVVQIARGELDTVAAALDTTSEVLASRADLTPETRTALGLPALGEQGTLVDGRTWDLTAGEAARVADFIRGLIAARDL